MSQSHRSAVATTRRPVTNRCVSHIVTLTLSTGESRVVTRGPRPDWSWQDLVNVLERQWPTGRVTVERGKGRHRRMIYETTRV